MTKEIAIFLPGWGSSNRSRGLYFPFLAKLRGFDDIVCLFKPHLGINHPIADLSNIAATHIKTLPQDAHYTFIGYSMGGVIALDLVTYNKFTDPRIITIAAPIHGADKHKTLHTLSTIWSRSSLDLTPGSTYLSNLHYDLKNTDLDVLSLSADHDGVISKKSATFINAEHYEVTNATHLSILYNQKTTQKINKWLELVPRPTSITFVDLGQKFR